MTTNLYWSPVAISEKRLPCNDTDLKRILQNRFHGFVDVELDKNDIIYFEALKDAEIDGADHIIELINTYNKIKLKEHS